MRVQTEVQVRVHSGGITF